MSTDPIVEPRNDVERLFQELLDSGGVSFTVLSGDGFFSVGLRGAGHEAPRCSCHQELWIAATESWTLYARFGSVRLVRFVREPREEPYGTVGVFEDLYGNLWDLIQPLTPPR